MRSLTDAEGRVIAVLLGAASANERERLRRVGSPRSTFHAARRRVYAEGWLKDRYVPNPSRFGFGVVTFVLLRPFADRVQELTERWSADASNVLTWSTSQLILGVFFHRDAASARRFAQELSELRAASALTIVLSEAAGPEIPVYFDYEGLWTHLAGVSGTLAYPRGLGGGASSDGTDRESISSHHLWAATELVGRPFGGDAGERPGHLVGPLGLPFSHQHVLRRGWVAHRVFLEPSVLPPYKGRSAD
ncbi:MAG TPA: hypothetical protein VIZ68_02010, partial [Thermoplasmata archaeon]